MDSILERLGALAARGGDPDSPPHGDYALDAKQELVAEALALWRTLETVLATLRPQDLSVGDPMFAKLLACARAVLRDPEHWCVHAADKHAKGVYVFVNRVLVKLGCRGDREREALTHDGVVELLFESMRGQSDSALAASSALQVLQTLAFDAKNRTALDATGSLPFTLALMKQHPRDAHVQVSGCKFLQLMVYDEACKEKLARSSAVFVILDALRRFPTDVQVATSAVDLIYFLGMELESSAVLTPTAETQLAATIESILECVLRAMHSHSQVEQVQSNGVAILNTFVGQSQARHVISKGTDNGGSSIWELVLGVLSCCCCPSGSGGSDGCEAASDAVGLLDALLSDPLISESIENMLATASSNDLTKSATIQTLKALKTKLDQLSSIDRAQHVSSRLESLVEHARARFSTNDNDSMSRQAELSLCQVSRQLAPPESDFRTSDQQHSSPSSPCSPNPCPSSSFVMHREDDESETPLATPSGELHYSAGSDPIGNNHDTQARLFLGMLDENSQTVSIDATHSINSTGHRTLHDLALYANDSPRFLDEMTLDSETGGFFEQFLRDTDNRFRPSGGEQPKHQQALPPPPLMHPPIQTNTRLSLESTASSQAQQICHPSASNLLLESTKCGSGGMVNSVESILASASGVAANTTLERDALAWRAMYESSVEEVRVLKMENHNLQEDLKIVSRRAQEQAKLLNLQNSRIVNHMEVHQHVLERVRTLEESLSVANRKYQVERELRNAEVAQCEKITLALHDARKEIKMLSSQNSSASRELMHKEKLRVDYQQKTSEIKHLKERIELERDDAIILARRIGYEKEELMKLLEGCRQEGLEALLMREEDVDAPKPRVFAEIGRSSPSSGTRNRGIRRGSTYSGSYSEHPHKGSSYSPFAVQPIDTLVGTSTFSTYGGRGSPRKQSAFGSFESSNNRNADPETIEREDIEASLHEIFESLSSSIEGSGVHIATVRRFFLESGIVQPPNVFAADIDVILAKVLNQLQENRRKVVVRRDYAFAQTAPPPAAFSASETKKFRYFDQDAFNEAVTLVGMKRYPRFDVTRVLQTVVAEYLHPIQRRMRANSMLARTSGSSSGATQTASSFSAGGNSGSALHRRSSSMHSLTGGSGSFCGSPGVISPSSACSVVMRTILNSLVLHISHGNDNNQRTSGGVDADESLNMGTTSDVWGKPRRHSREDIVYSMLEMHSILARELRPLGTICEFYSAIHHHQNVAARDELLGISFELVLNFAMDFEIIPSFMDRVTLKHLYAEVSGLIKAYLALQKRFPHATDAETLKKVAFLMTLARVAIELFSAKVDFETPEKQVTGLLQWLDNSAGREKIMRKATLPIVIKFSRKLYALRI